MGYLFHDIYISVDLALHGIFRAKVDKGGILSHFKEILVNMKMHLSLYGKLILWNYFGPLTVVHNSVYCSFMQISIFFLNHLGMTYS